jgi:hypothetical protein
MSRKARCSIGWMCRPTASVPADAIWLDLVNPAPGEDKLVERRLGIAVPTREEMQEIEVSSRLYVEHHARFMTATLMCNSDTATPKTTAVTFILARHCLVTVRYDDPRPFMIVGTKLMRTCPAGQRRGRAAGTARCGHRSRSRPARAHRQRNRPRVAHDLRAGERLGRRDAVQGTSSRPSEARATSRRRCARAWCRSAGCFCSWPTRPRACAGPRTCGCSCSRCSATCCRCRITPPISATRSPSCSTPCWASCRSSRTTSSRYSRLSRWRSCRRR